MLKLEQILEAVKQDQEKGESPWCDMKTPKLESDAADEMFQGHGRGCGSWDDFQRPFSWTPRQHLSWASYGDQVLSAGQGAPCSWAAKTTWVSYLDVSNNTRDADQPITKNNFDLK